MQTYLCILRGINVSGQKMIKMDELKNLFQKLLFKNVQTYIQSGNVIFQTDRINSAELGKQIASRINEVFGFEVPVLVLTMEQLKKVYGGNDFINERKEDISKLYVTFMSHTPEQTHVDKLNEGNYGTDEFSINDHVIYLCCPENGYGKTKLNNGFIESKLKVTATTRNWKTVTELVRLASEIAGK